MTSSALLDLRRSGAASETPPARPVLAAVPDAVVRAEPDAVPGLVRELISRWTGHGAEIVSWLRPGVPAEDLAEAAERFPALARADLRAWWSAFDGVDPCESGDHHHLPTVGPGAWVPLCLSRAIHLSTAVASLAEARLLPVFIRDGEVLAVRADDAGSDTVVEVGIEDGDQDFEAPFAVLLSAWVDALSGSVTWNDGAQDWLSDAFAIDAAPRPELVS